MRAGRRRLMRALHQFPDIANIVEAFLRVFFQAPSQHPTELRGRRIERGLLHDDGGQHFGEIVPLEQALAGDQFVEHHAEGPDIRPLVDVRLRLGLLGRHVGCGSQNDSRVRGRHAERRGVRQIHICGFRLKRLRQPEIQNLHLAVRRDLHICGFEVPMDDALLMSGLQRLGHLLRYTDRLVNRRRTARSNRATRSLSWLKASGRSLIATLRPSFESLA